MNSFLPTLLVMGILVPIWFYVISKVGIKDNNNVEDVD